MKRSQINAAISRAISSANQFSVALPQWAQWLPEQFGPQASGMRRQKLGWKVVDFGVGDFEHCGLVILCICAPLVDERQEPLKAACLLDGFEYPPSAFSRKYLFVQAGQTEPHHFHRQKTRKEVSVVAGAPVRFELAWAESDTALSERDVDVQVDGIWQHLGAGGSLVLNPGQTITIPACLSHIISVAARGADSIMLETSTANNDATDNIFPFMTPVLQPVQEDEPARFQLLDEHNFAATTFSAD